MPNFVDSGITPAADFNIAMYTGAGTIYTVQTSAGVWYQVFIDVNSDVEFRKSTDGGKTWSAATEVFNGTAIALAVWFDPWSGISGGLIHCAYIDSGTDDALYRSINTASADALSTQTTIFAGATTGANGCLSITRTRGGNLICCGDIDGGTEQFAAKSTDVGATWGAIASPMEAVASDMIILAPGFAADNQDAICIFWDASASEISRKLYDDSGDAWAETSIATSMTAVAATTAFPNFSVAVDLTNSQLVLAAWSNVDLANADLRCWTVTESAITETATNVVLNSTDDQAMCQVSIDTTNDDWYVYYAGKSDGSEALGTNMNIYYKLSTDAGATWGAETQVTQVPSIVMRWFSANPRMAYLSADLAVARITSTSGSARLAFTSIMPSLPTAAQVQSGITYGINGTQFTGTYTGGASGVVIPVSGRIVA